MASTEEIQIIHKVGWWEKEISRGYLKILKYRPRFLILTNTHLKYYHQSPLEASGNLQPAKEIPLFLINENAMMEHALHEPDILHIEFGPDAKVYRFRSHNVDEVPQWRAHISASRGKSSEAKVHFSSLPEKAVSSDVFVVNKVELKIVNNKDVADWMSVYDQVKEDVLEMESYTCSSAERTKFTANCFFDSLLMMGSKDRNNLSKEMGKAMLAWLDTDYDVSVLLDENFSSVVGVTSQRTWTKMDVFTTWLRIALSREYLASCKFEDNNGANDDMSSESSSNMTHSTIKSRMRKARMGSIIMPFRADTAETLFISAIIHSASFKHHLLNQLLHAMLRPVAQMPESFVYPRAVSMTPPAIMSTPLEVGNSPLLRGAPAEEKLTGANSFSRRSRRFIGDVVRNLLRINHHQNTASQSHTEGGNTSSPSDPPIMEVGAGRTMRTSPADLPAAVSRPSLTDDSLPQPPFPTTAPLLTPVELQRLEVRKRLLDLIMIFCQRFEDTATLPNFPRPICNILSTIRDLIIVTRPENIVVPRVQDIALGDSRMLEEEREIMYKNRMRFEYGTFFTSCSALLFLRLICRAVISPEEYGVLEKVSTFDDHSTSIGAEETIEDPRMVRSRQSFAAMVILSHVIRKETKPMTIEAMETGSDGSASHNSNGNSGVSRPPKRSYHHHRDYSNDTQGGFIHSILSFADELSTKAPRPAATKCLDYLQSHKFSFQDWSAVSQGKTVGISVPKSLSPKLPTTPPSSSAAEGGEDESYSLDVSKPNTRWALAEVAKTLQHIANISCLPTEEMFTFAKESLIRQNIQAGLLDRDSYDTHQLTTYEEETINIQLQIASKIKEGYERLADLPSGNW